MAKAKKATEEAIDRPQLEQMREEALDQLSMSKQRLSQLLPFYAIGKISEEEKAEAEQSVRSAEQKLEGLGYWFDKADAEDQEREKAAKEAANRKRAIEVLSLVHQHYWAVVDIDKARGEAAQAISRTQALGGQIQVVTAGCFDDSSLSGEDDLRNFLGNLGLYGIADISVRASNDLGRPGSYSASLPFTREAALRALAKVLPQVLDEDVQKEAAAAAHKAYAARCEANEDDAGEEPTG